MKKTMLYLTVVAGILAVSGCEAKKPQENGLPEMKCQAGKCAAGKCQGGK